MFTKLIRITCPIVIVDSFIGFGWLTMGIAVIDRDASIGFAAGVGFLAFSTLARLTCSKTYAQVKRDDPLTNDWLISVGFSPLSVDGRRTLEALLPLSHKGFEYAFNLGRCYVWVVDGQRYFGVHEKCFLTVLPNSMSPSTKGGAVELFNVLRVPVISR